MTALGLVVLLQLAIDAQPSTCRDVERTMTLPGAFGRIETPWRTWTQSWRALRRNIGRFIRSDLHYFAGMRGLIQAFYTAILDGGAPPISCAEMRRVTHLMDTIFKSCRENSAAADARHGDALVMEGATVCMPS